MQNLKNTTTNTPSKSMVKDLNDSYIGKDLVTHARNAVVNSHKGDIMMYSPEPANRFCVALPYVYNGSIPLKDKRHLVFSTDNTNSEIGIVDEKDCTYVKVINDPCLGFKQDFPHSGRSKETSLCAEVITFTNSLAPVRRLDLSNIPYKFTVSADDCKTKIFTTDLDCAQLNLFRQINVPQVTVSRIPTGSLPNGAYQVVMAYVVNDQKYSDYYGLSIPIHIFDQSGTSGGITATFDNLDQEFLQYQVVLLSTNQGVTIAKNVGIFSTTQSTITITENNRSEYIPVPLSDLVITKINYDRAGIISGNSKYLILADLTQKAKLNYQQAALQISTKYVVKQVPFDYYEDNGEDIGHYRDEIYSYFLEWLYTDGSSSDAFVTAGRKTLGDELSLVTGDDVFEYDKSTGLATPKQVYNFQVYNTAQQTIQENNPFVNNSRVFGTGYMAYWQSTDLYPDNPIYGLDACTPIRHHKFPDESIIPRYSTINGQLYINILGVQFDNITHPLDAEGNKVQGIAGYQILRGDRSGGNRSIIARGVISNVRAYNEVNGSTTTEVQYSNYPYNFLGPDTFFSEDPVSNKGNNENNYIPPTKVYYDRYNFYTPHAYFNNKYRMGREFIIESEEIGNVSGYFEPVYQHPKNKLLSNFSLYFAILAGAIEGYLAVNGKKTVTSQYSNFDTGVTDAAGVVQGTAVIGTVPGAITTIPGTVAIPSVYPTTIVSKADSLFGPLSLPKGLSLLDISARVLIIALQALAAVGAFIYSSAEFAANALQIVMGFSNFEQYAYQYDSHADFSKQGDKVQKGNKRRYAVHQPQYISSALQSVNNTLFNNFGKQESIYIQFNKAIAAPSIVDDTQRTMSTFGTASNPSQKVSSTASMFYVTSKESIPDQYGQVDTVQKVKTSNSYTLISIIQDSYTSPILFGGDCIIARFSVLTKQPIFQQSFEGQNNRDGMQYNYNLYRNIAHPRFWIDSTDWQIGDLVTKSPSFGKLPNTKYNLDGKGNSSSTTAWTVQNRYFYLYINGVLDFLVEADYNISLRQGVPAKPFYATDSTNLTEIFRSDRLKVPEPFILDQSFYKLQADQIYAPQQAIDYNPTIDAQCSVHQRNSLIYSLPSFNGTKVDNWEYFLPANYFSFDQNDFGNLITVKKLDQDRVIFLFDNSSPYVSFGQDELQTTDGRKVTIGDGGLFARPPRELEHTDVSYGNSKSKYAFVSTQYGAFYPSFSQGRIFNFTGQLDEISREGIHYWCQQYMPIQLYSYYPAYSQIENPFTRVGYFTFFDNFSKTVYISKKDYIPQPQIQNITYNPILDQFVFEGRPIQLNDPTYFMDVSWTLSYSPENKGFISYHDWHPDGVIQTENHFMTVKGNTLWKHNERCDLFSNFYGVDYPFEIEYASTTGQQIHVVDSIEYNIEAYHYKNNCMDKFHALSENFDKLIVHNSEQISGLLTLVQETEDPYANELYPVFNGNGYNILFSKTEQKYRISQFDDITKDRGEFSNNEFALFYSHPSGYKRIINPGAIDFNKDSYQRKNFRHYSNFFWFSKSVVGASKILCKWFNTKLTISPK